MSKIFGVHTTPNYFKNYLINSNMDFWQRTTVPGYSNSFSSLTNDVCNSVDRWRAGYNGASPPNIAQNSATGPNSQAIYYAEFQSAATSNTVNFLLHQRIESNLSRELVSQTISVGGWFRSSTSGPANVTLSINIPTATDNYASTTSPTVPNATQTIPTNNTWVYLSWTNIAMPSNANNGVEIYFQSQTFNPGGVIRTYDIGQVMCNIGPTVAPWRMHGETLDQELVGCQRFYEKSDTGTGTTATLMVGTAAATNTYLSLESTFKVTKRGSPTMVIWDSAGHTNKVDGLAPNSANTSNLTHAGIVSDGVTGVHVFLDGQSTYAGIRYGFGADSEL